MKSLITVAIVTALTQFAAPSALAGEFRDKAVQAQLEKGTLRLKHSLFGKGISRGAELNRLYNEKQMPELVEAVVGTQFVSDLYYFYLGAAAESLGYPDAATTYYQLALAMYRNGDKCSFGFDSCYTVPMPGAVTERIDALKNAEIPRDKVLKVLTSQGAPAQGVRVDSAGSRKGASCTTDDSGSCKLTVALKSKEDLTVTLSKPGLIPEADFIPAAESSRTITMRATREMICDELKSASAAATAAALERHVDLVVRGAKLQGAKLEDGGICLSTFKKANYLSFKLNSRTMFDENKLTSYMIGATVFDDVVKKMLLVMEVSASDLKIDGYDVSVASNKRSFSQPISPHLAVNFRFYFPKQLVAKYQDKDISGQQLLDGSVILLNDDRVDLKLQ